MALILSGGLLRLARCGDGKCRFVGQVGNLRRVDNPLVGVCKWAPSAGCQPARRVPSCPTKPAECSRISRASIIDREARTRCMGRLWRQERAALGYRPVSPAACCNRNRSGRESADPETKTNRERSLRSVGRKENRYGSRVGFSSTENRQRPGDRLGEPPLQQRAIHSGIPGVEIHAAQKTSGPDQPGDALLDGGRPRPRPGSGGRRQSR